MLRRPPARPVSLIVGVQSLMARLNRLQRAALTVYVIPFFVGGILLGTWSYTWLNEHAHLPAWAWPLMLAFSVVGILLGAPIAYFILMLGLFWLLSHSPLLLEGTVESPTGLQRMIFPLFHAVREFAHRIAPRAG